MAMPPRVSIQNQAKSEDASTAATVWLPQDVLDGVLLRLPVSDLLRFRRVCKDWREVISDPAFVDEHMDHGPQAPTHTIMFFPGGSPAYRHDGDGYLLDEHWRVTARFMVGESEDMVGACNGLLCFLDVLNDNINIVDPFTGDSITMPLPPETDTWHTHRTYSFGFDRSSRRYKLIHLPEALEQGLHVYTIGEDTHWRSVHVAGAASGDFYTSPKIVGGAMYWSVIGKDRLRKLMRFDLATEVTTSELIEFRWPKGQAPFSSVFDVSVVLDAGVCLMTNGRLGEQNLLFIGVGARWANKSAMRLPPWRRLTWPQPLQRGHLLLADQGNGGLYAHPIALGSDDLGLGNLVLQMAIRPQDACKGGTNSTPRCNTRGFFVPVLEGGRRVPQEESDAKTYCYAPPLSLAPLARYFGKR